MAALLPRGVISTWTRPSVRALEKLFPWSGRQSCFLPPNFTRFNFFHPLSLLLLHHPLCFLLIPASLSLSLLCYFCYFFLSISIHNSSSVAILSSEEICEEVGRILLNGGKYCFSIRLARRRSNPFSTVKEKRRGPSHSFLYIITFLFSSTVSRSDFR